MNVIVLFYLYLSQVFINIILVIVLFNYNKDKGFYRGGLFNVATDVKNAFRSFSNTDELKAFFNQAKSSGFGNMGDISTYFESKLVNSPTNFGLDDKGIAHVRKYFDYLKKEGKTINQLSLEKFTTEIEGIGVGASKASKAMEGITNIGGKLLGSLASAGLSMAVSAAIGWIVGEIGKIHISAKEAEEALNSFTDSFKEFNSEITAGKKKLPELEKEYWNLADGVDSLGNNVSLTEEQYETYLQTVEDIHELMPSLSTYFNEQGQAIGFVKSEMKGLNDQYKQYEQNQIHERWFTEEDDGHTKMEKVIEGINNQSEEFKQIKNKFGKVVYSAISSEDYKYLSNVLQTKTQDELYDYVEDLINRQNIPINQLGAITNRERELLIALAGSDVIEYDDNLYTPYKLKKDKNGDNAEVLFDYLKDTVKSKKEQLDDNNVNIRNAMTAVAKDSDAYLTLSGTESEDLVNFINSFDFASLAADRGKMSQGDFEGLAAQLIKGVQVEGFSEAFHNVLDDDKISTMSYKEAEKFVDKNLKVIRKAMGWKKDSNEYLNFKATLGFEADDEELFNQASEKTGIPIEKIKELFTKGEIELIANVDFKPSGSGKKGKYTEDEYDKAKADVEQYAEVKNAQTELDTADNKLKSSLKTIENYGVHYGKIVEMVNGTRFITDPKELNELLEALPELKDHLKYTESGWMLEAEAMDGVQKSVLSLQQAYVEAQQILSDSAVTGAMTRIGINESELTSMTSIADAYKLLAQKFKGGITFTASGELDTSTMTNDQQLAADGVLASLRLSQAQKVMQKTAKLSAESAKEDRKKQIKDLKDQQYLADLQHQFEKINQTLEEFTKQLEILKKAQDDLFESDYIGKLDYINQRYETQNNQVEETQKSLDELLAMQPETAQGWNELATTVENLSTKLFESKRALVEYQVELSQTYMNGLKAIGEASKSALEDSTSQYDRNVKMLKEGGLGGLQFKLTPIVPKDAVEKQREENKKLAKEEETYQEKVNQIKKRALDEMKAYEDAERARQLADLTSEASEAMASLNEDFWKAMNMGWSDFKELIETEGIDVNINWSGIGSSSKSDMKRLYADQHGIEIIENPERKKGDKGTGWKYKTADGKEFENIEQARTHTNELIISGNSKAGTRTQLGKDLGFTVKKAKDGSNEYIYTTSKGTEVKYDDLNSLKTVFKNLNNKSDGTSKEIFCNYFGVTIDKTNPKDWKYTYQGNTKENIEDIKKLVTTNTGISFKAKGGDATGDILVNEEGQESYLGKDGKLHLFKPGAQFFNTDEAIRVFNAEDTKKIRKYTGDKYFNEPIGDLSKVTQLANGNIKAVFPAVTPKNANDTTSSDTIGKAIEKATEEHYDRLSNIQNKALNEEISMDVEAQAITEAQKEQHYDNLELAQQTTNDITSQEQIADNAEKVTEEKRFSAETEAVVTELLNWMKNNPIKAPGLDTASWEQMISDAQGYMSRMMGGSGTGVRGEINGDMPYYNQGDYSAYTYGGKPMNTNACAPTSMAMVLSYLGKNVNPVEAAKYSEKNKFYIFGQGTSWGLFDSMAKAYGVNCDTIGSSSSAIISSLKAGRPVIVSVTGGTFNPSGSGHIFVLAGIDDNGKIIVNDPGSRERTSKTWDISAITSNAKNAWSFYATGTKDYGIAGENYKKEYLIDKKTGRWTAINSPTLIDTDEVDVVGEKASAKIDKPLPMYANGTLGNMDMSSEMPKLTTEQIQKILSTNFANSKLNVAGAAEGIFNAQQSTGVSALAMLAIAAGESGWGTSKLANAKNNYWGWNHYPANGKSAFERATTFSSNPGEAFKAYGEKLISAGYSEQSLAEMADRYCPDGKWYGLVSGTMSSIVNTLNDAGLGDMSANIATTASNTASITSNVSSIRHSFDSQLQEWLNGGDSTSTSSTTEDELLAYIKENINLSEYGNEEFIKKWDAFQEINEKGNIKFKALDEFLLKSVGTGNYNATKDSVVKEINDYTNAIMEASAEANLAELKRQYDINKDIANKMLASYNYKKAEGATADVLTTIINLYKEQLEKVNDISDEWVSTIQSLTDYLMSQDATKLQAHDDRLSWIEKENEEFTRQYENTDENDFASKTALAEQIVDRHNQIISENVKKQNTAHQNVLDLYNNEDYMPIFERYDVEAWFDASGEATAKYKEELAALSATDSELAAVMTQVFAIIQQNKKAFYEANEAIQSADESLIDFNKNRKLENVDVYIKYQERLVEALDFDASISQSLSTAKEGMYNIFKTLRDEKAEMDKELKANMQIDDWLTEDTRKLLFNLDDYEEQMETINGIQAEAEKLYINYKNELEGLKEDELYKEEEITAEYNRQLEKLQDKLSVAKADLQLAKDKAAFENTRKERDTQIIMGNGVRNVADPERLREAAMKMAESESALGNEVTTSNENQDIRNMEVATGMINQEKAAIQNRIDMINDMTSAEREALAGYIEPIEIIGAKLNAISKTNPERIINEDNSNKVLSGLDLTKRDGWSLTGDYSEMVEMFSNLLENGYYKKNTFEYDMVKNLVEWIKWQHDNKTTSDAYNYGYSLYNADNAYLWGKGAMKIYSDDAFRVMSQSAVPIDEYINDIINSRIDEEKLNVVVSGGINVVTNNPQSTYPSFLDGYEELDGVSMFQQTLGVDEDAASAIFERFKVGNIAPTIDTFVTLAEIAKVWGNASDTRGNTDNSVHMENVNITLEKPVTNPNDFVQQFINKVYSEYSTTNNQR